MIFRKLSVAPNQSITEAIEAYSNEKIAVYNGLVSQLALIYFWQHQYPNRPYLTKQEERTVSAYEKLVKTCRLDTGYFNLVKDARGECDRLISELNFRIGRAYTEGVLGMEKSV